MLNLKITRIIMLVSVICLFTALLVGPVSAADSITFPYDGDLELTYVGSSAGYNNWFGFVNQSGAQPLGRIHSVTPPASYNIGRCVKDEPIILFIVTPYFSLFRTDKPNLIDHLNHAAINGKGNTFTVGFEDTLFGGDRDYDDVLLTVTCKPDDNGVPVPEFPTIAFPLGVVVGLIGFVYFMKERKKELLK